MEAETSVSHARAPRGEMLGTIFNVREAKVRDTHPQQATGGPQKALRRLL